MNSVNEKVLSNTSQRVKAAFNFEEHEIRTVMRDGECWFVAADVCAALHLSNPTKSVSALDDDEKALTSIQGLSRGNEQANIISESGLYTLILRCRDAVKQGTLPWRFRKWVTSEVLPSIRKLGQYSAAPLSSKVEFTISQSEALEFRGSSVTQLNALFVCTDALRSELWPHLSALFPGLKSEYQRTFETLAMVSALLKCHKMECQIMAENIMARHQ
ncbi:hypothetical protein GEX15_20280 [Salmonella enterica]|nr:hypothetical protein [Salmonella enterica]EFT9362498.1 hypothetical protein [Salmonella enterica]EIM8804827.1 hypothetical protein [Salmonella enterica]